MVLIDPISTGPATSAVRVAKTPAPAPAVPYAALDRLSELRGEAVQDLQLFRFLAHAPQACLILMASGAGLLVWQRLSASSTGLENEFIWALSVLAGVAAMTGLHIRSYAHGAARIPAHKAAVQLRRLLFYTGATWGLGAFLVLPDLPAPALAVAFAAVPSLGLSLLLGDQKGATAFVAPVILATASAASLEARPSGLWVAATILAMGLLSFSIPMLQREISARRDFLPAGGTV
jgi:hypothetical protein